jgi:hypothetical protein
MAFSGTSADVFPDPKFDMGGKPVGVKSANGDNTQNFSKR